MNVPSNPSRRAFKKLFKRHGVDSIQQMASLLGVTKECLYKWTKNPGTMKLSNMEAIAYELGMSDAELVSFLTELILIMREQPIC